MDYREARLKLKKGQLLSLYLFSGSEDTLKEELLLEMIGVMHHKGLEPDLLRIDGKKLGWQELRRELDQVTIFSRGRVLLVKDSPYFANVAEKSTKTSKKEPDKQKGRNPADEPQQEELATWLDGTNDTLLIFFVQNVDKRRKITKYLDKTGAMIEFPPLKGAALVRWIRDELSREQKQIDEKALTVLMERSGENMALLKRELEKLVTCLGDLKTIDCSLVEKLVPENAQGNVFNLVDELGRKNAVGALHHLHMMRQQNEPPLRILAMIIRHFRLLYRTSLLSQGGLASAKISTTLQVPSFVAGKFLEQLPNFPGDSLPSVFNTLKEVDLTIKTGRLSGEEALEQLIINLTFK